MEGKNRMSDGSTSSHSAGRCTVSASLMDVAVNTGAQVGLVIPSAAIIFGES